jgi:hypothetical protein
MNRIAFLRTIKIIFSLCAMSLFLFSCQEENIQTSEADTTTTLVPNTTLPLLMERVALLDGSADNFIDNANCLLVDLPVTIGINGIAVPLTNANQYEQVIDLINGFNDFPIFTTIDYPITVTLSDYTTITIENEQELLAQAANCSGPNQPDIDIECIDFQYPFSIALFDTNFEVTETINISSDESLFNFLATLTHEIIAGINYPISLEHYDGTVITVNSNEELETAIAAAEDTCDEDDDNSFNDANCTEPQVTVSLIDCYWRITNFAGNMELEYEFYFNDDGTFTFSSEPTSSTAYTGNWEVAISQGSLVLTVSNIDTELTIFNNSWIIDECSETELVLHSGNQEITLEKFCINNSPFECFSGSQATICDEENPYDGFVEMNLEALFITNVSCTQEYIYSFHLTQMDAVNNTAPLNPTSYTNTAQTETLFLRIQDLTGNFEIYDIAISVEDCCTNNTILTENLVLYMPFANQTKDLVSNWEASGSYNYVADRAGNQTCALAFSGNETVAIPVNTINQIVQGDAFSVSLWFKMQNTNPSNYEILFQKGSSVSEGFQISVFDLNTPVFSDADSGYGLWDDPWNMDANLPTDTTNWHHLVITVDENSTVRLYRDGVQRNVDENASIDIGNSPLQNYILGNGFQGHLDDLRVYKVALNPNQVSQLFTLEADCNNCL